MASSVYYTPVSTTEPLEMSNSGMRESEAMRRGATYSSRVLERRTPRLPNESDDAYRRRIRAQHISALLHSAGWVAAAIGVIYYTDMWNVVRYDVRVNQ